MYVPTAFAGTDLTRLHDFVERNGFGLRVSQVDRLPFANHCPSPSTARRGRTAPSPATSGAGRTATCRVGGGAEVTLAGPFVDHAAHLRTMLGRWEGGTARDGSYAGSPT